MAISNQYFEFVKDDYKDSFGVQQLYKVSPNIVNMPVEMLLVKVILRFLDFKA